ncbi:MAG: hypothetical protein AAGD11_20640 [Planctomycetota bacterium]
MSSPNGLDQSASLRWGTYSLLIALAVGSMTGRLMAVNSVNRIELQKHLIRQDIARARQRLQNQQLPAEEYERRLAAAELRIRENRQLERPFLSANDRSRWLAMRALVEHGTYEIDAVLDRNRWNTIDMVQHRGRDGELHLYSSKPPLLYTLLAADYWLLSKLTGMTLGTHPYLMGRMMLVMFNIVPLAVMFFYLAKLAERFGTTDWGRIFVVASACFGTLLNAFAVALNNHLIAAVSATLALYGFVRIWCDGESHLRYYILTGFFAAFTAANELPALAFLTLIAIALLTVNSQAWLKGFLPAAALVVIGFFATNYAAHNCLTPPYMHKGSDDPEENWYMYEYTIEGVTRQSYWQNRQGVDIGEPSKAVYAMHCLVGHHGIFSLTPIWLLSFVGMTKWLRADDARLRWIASGIGLLTIVVLTFYIALRPQVDRNYGGVSCGLRWMIWFAPLWIVAMIPAADRVARSRGWQTLAFVLLAVSVFSASFPTWNPWTHPWPYQFMEYLTD